ncbi:MAG: uroporphyrinogen decarboxylase family protein [Planctomycetota bacterium]
MSRDRDWIQQTLAHQATDPPPYNFDFTPPAQKMLERHLRAPDLDDALALPIRTSGPRSVKPLYADPASFGETLADEFGVTWRTSPIDRGVPIGPPLRAPNLSHYPFPDPSASYRFDHLADWCRANADHYRILWVGDLWERASFMRGMSDLLSDLALNPSFVHRLLDRLAEYVLRTMQVLFARFPFEGVALSDDYGTQKALIMSPRDWRAFVKPHLAQIYALAKTNRRTVFHHSCGNVIEIIPDLIDLGLDILHPVQPEAMDVFDLKRRFGRHLTLCGGLRTQDLLPRGTPDQVRAEVRRLKSDLGRDGGYILEPGITIQADVPLENILAMIDEARRPL